MKKIFVYIGSQGGEISNTLKFTKLILNKVLELTGENVNIDMYHPQNSHIKRCLGCTSCFNTGTCPLEEEDDLKEIKEKMLASDFIIFGTPIYGANVSGDMKIFFDRITYWMHLMRLAGKPAMALTTSSGNGVQFTLNYLNTVMSFLGLKTVEKFNVNVFSPKQLEDPDFMKEEIDKYSQVIFEYLIGLKKVESDHSLELIFSSMKKNIRMYELYPNYEFEFWKDNGLFNMSTFQHVIDSNKKLIKL